MLNGANSKSHMSLNESANHLLLLADSERVSLLKANNESVILLLLANSESDNLLQFF